MIGRPLALALLLGSASLVWPQGAEDTAAIVARLKVICRSVLCRTNRPITLKLQDGKLHTFPGAPLAEIVPGGMITVNAGETVMVEGTLRGGRLVDLVAVAKNTHPDRTLVFNLNQETSVGDGLGMILTVKSPFPGALKYKLDIAAPMYQGMRPTSVCPLKGGLVSFEHWPYPVFDVLARDFEQVDPSSPAASKCE